MKGIGFAIFLFSGFCLVAEELEFRQFSDKEGSKIEAALLGITEDRSKVKIQRRDGMEFEIPVNKLSLEDQQFVETWLENRPKPEMADKFRLNVEAELIESEPERFARDTRTLEKRMANFEIKIGNQSRETLENAKLEYILIWEDRVILKTDNDGTKSFILQRDRFQVGRKGAVDIPPVGFNREVELESEKFEQNRVDVAGGPSLGVDRVIGIHMRVVGPSGEVLFEVQTPEKELEGLDWEKAAALPEPVLRD